MKSEIQYNIDIEHYNEHPNDFKVDVFRELELMSRGDGEDFFQWSVAMTPNKPEHNYYQRLYNLLLMELEREPNE